MPGKRGKKTTNQQQVPEPQDPQAEAFERLSDKLTDTFTQAFDKLQQAIVAMAEKAVTQSAGSPRPKRQAEEQVPGYNTRNKGLRPFYNPQPEEPQNKPKKKPGKPKAAAGKPQDAIDVQTVDVNLPAASAQVASVGHYQPPADVNIPPRQPANNNPALAINITNWYKYLSDYHDPLLCEFLQFGWPLGYNYETAPATTSNNHPSALFHLQAVKDFVDTELMHDALLGPFDEAPFTPWFRTSPLMSRAKKGSEERRIIVDLSYPQGSSVNDGIDPSNHLGVNITYSLPTINDLITTLQQHGKGAYLWKADLRRAYRQIRSDPLDAPFLGIKVGSQIFVDRCPPFGCRSSASICQRMANGLVFIMAKENHTITAYLDDFRGCHPSYHLAKTAYDRFLGLAQELGLELSTHKCSPPSKTVEWLGYRVDSDNLSITIPAEKLQEILTECERWINRDKASKKMIQSIVGKLIFISNFVRPGRKFLARILSTLSHMEDNAWTTLSDHFKSDIKWFYYYAKSANGIFLCTPSRPTREIECDSSFQAGGGNTEGFY